VSREDDRFGYRHHFDVHPDEDRLLFSGYREGEVDVWTSALDGSGLEKLTGPPHTDLNPRWAGAEGEGVLYISRRGEQDELWTLDARSGEAGRVSVAGRVEAIDDVSADGSVIAVRILQEEANLWWVDPRGGDSHQLTADTLSDFGPSMAREGGIVVFQRARNVASGVMDAAIHVARWESGGLVGEERVVAAGFRPSLSPDGMRVAYAETLPDGSPGARVRGMDLDSGRVWAVSDRLQEVGLREFPHAWLSRSYAWAPDGSALYHVALSPEGMPELRRQVPGAEDGGDLLLTAPSGRHMIQDLHLSPDGERLVYLLVLATDPGRGELREFVLENSTDSARFAVTALPGSSPWTVICRGFLADGESVLLARSALNPDLSEEVEFLVHHPSRGGRPIGRAEAAYPQTAVLDVGTGLVFLTMADAGVHNVYSLSLETGEFHRITDNRLPGVSFSGLQVFPDGTLLASHHQRNLDLWLLAAQQ
jgi:Tol biopolymer transport system component